jgi:hypothetical protein
MTLTGGPLSEHRKILDWHECQASPEPFDIRVPAAAEATLTGSITDRTCPAELPDGAPSQSAER